MNIVIVGPGAIGLLFYFLISKKVKTITLLDKNQERAVLLKEKGLTVLKDSKTYKIPLNITSNPGDLKEIDLFIICVKSYDTPQVAKSIKPLCNKDSYVLSLQNGLGNREVLSEILGEEKILGAITHKASTLIGDGSIRYVADGQTTIGRNPGKPAPKLREIRTIFNSCGISTSISKDFDSIIWSKLIINIAINPLTAILRLKNGDLLKFDETRLLMQMASSEAERIAKRKRIRLVYNDTQTKVEAVCRATSDNISSMLQDVLRNKKTEIDFLNGAICRLAQTLKIPAPVNFLLYQLIKTIEQSYSQSVGKNDI